MIPSETGYETYNQELLAIVEAFKNWRHYLEACKYEVLVLINQINLCRFIDTKILSFRQARWAHELCRYHLWIDHCQGKANATVDALSHFFKRSQAEKVALRPENPQILYRLQASLTRVSLAGLSLSTLAANSSEAPALSFSPLHKSSFVRPIYCPGYFDSGKSFAEN